MAKIKHTKNELKAQREALARFLRFLPMLQLKKQQLQAEIQTVDAKIAEKRAEEDDLHSKLEKWVKLLSDLPTEVRLRRTKAGPAGIEDLISLESITTGEGNIAGVNIPIFKDATIRKEDIDLFATPTWFDDAIEIIENLIRLRVEREIFEEQRRLIAEELRITTQRVNLFEKVKIPECRENIRVIRIFLGDEQTAQVARAKIAKNRTVVYEYGEVAA